VSADAALREIAQRVLGVSDFESTGSDRAGFVEVDRAALLEAMREAFNAGFVQRSRIHGMPSSGIGMARARAIADDIAESEASTDAKNRATGAAAVPLRDSRGPKPEGKAQVDRARKPIEGA
jgi:hypothetical protein